MMPPHRQIQKEKKKKLKQNKKLKCRTKERNALQRMLRK